MPNSGNKLLLVGCGKMGAAMLRGWLTAGLGNRIYTLDPAGLSADLIDFTHNLITHFKTAEEFVKTARKRMNQRKLNWIL